MKLSPIKELLVDTYTNGELDSYGLEAMEYLIMIVDYFITDRLPFNKENVLDFAEELSVTIEITKCYQLYAILCQLQSIRWENV